jgi:tRNA (Thr-GGU) A37 N-methylase
VRSCFKEKFAIPRQPQLAPAARGVLELVAPFDQGDAVQGWSRSAMSGCCSCFIRRWKKSHA